MAHRFIKKISFIGLDGLWTFLLSNLLITVTFSLTFWPSFFYVVLRAGRSNRTTDCKTLLVLGERLKKNAPGPNFIARLERACSVYTTQNIRQIFIVGGITGDATISESASGKNYLLDKKIPGAILIIEDKSQHTLDNIQNVRAMLPDYNVDKVGLITNRFHLARAGILAAGLGINYDLCAAEESFENNIGQWLAIIREAYFVHWYFTGKYWSTLINNKASLKRIR